MHAALPQLNKIEEKNRKVSINFHGCNPHNDPIYFVVVVVFVVIIIVILTFKSHSVDWAHSGTASIHIHTLHIRMTVLRLRGCQTHTHIDLLEWIRDKLMRVVLLASRFRKHSPLEPIFFFQNEHTFDETADFPVVNPLFRQRNFC